MKKHWLITAALGITAALAYAGQQDYQDQQQQAEHYAEMVCAGYWPEYSREVECEN